MVKYRKNSQRGLNMLQFGAVSIIAKIIPIIMMIIWLFVIGFVIYFLITAVRFMKNKNRTDQEILNKLDRLMEQLDQKNNSRD